MSRSIFLTLTPKKVAHDWEDALILATVKGFGLKLSTEGATCINVPFLSLLWLSKCERI